MQSSNLTLLLVSFVAFLSCHFTAVYGKCAGRWAIHACFGGNGKRSGPPLTDSRTDTAKTDKLSLLEQILLTPYDLDEISSEISPSQPDMAENTDELADLYPVLDEEYNRQRELKKTQALLTNLILSDRFRRLPTEQVEFKKR